MQKKKQSRPGEGGRGGEGKKRVGGSVECAWAVSKSEAYALWWRGRGGQDMGGRERK